MILRTDHWLPKMLGVSAITIYPYVFTADFQPSEPLMAHEEEHLIQVQRHGWISFYVSYMLFYLAGLIRWKSHSRAYWEIPYEKEARKAEKARADYILNGLPFL